MPKENKAVALPKHRNLQLSEIHTDPDTFQPRSYGLDYGHIAELKKKLATGEPLDAIKVRQCEKGSFIVLDGHHSLAAYEEAGWGKLVPALVYKCTVEQGQLIAVQENSKARLQMTHKDKSDWAWKLTCEQPDLSKAQVAKACGIGTTTVHRMRATRDELTSRGVLPPERWGAALRAKAGTDMKEWTDEERDEWEQAIHDKLRRNIAPHIAPFMADHPGLVVEVLATIMGENRFNQGAEAHGYWEGHFDDDTGDFILADPMLMNRGPAPF